ncbi:hypothetical protein CMU77_11325 [Elizabethkingia anophelis]|nr:hypothetical protein [Elizabethkingia anophelis]
MKMENLRRILIDRRFLFPGIDHNVVEHLFGGNQVVEMEVGFKKFYPGMLSAARPKPGFKVYSLIFQSFCLGLVTA